MARILTIDLADEAQISYRMADHWCRKGYIVPRVQGTGSGVAREFDESEVAVAVETAALVRAGFTPKAAAPIAREVAGHVPTDLDVLPVISLGGAYRLVKLLELSEPPASVGGMGENQ